MDVNNTPFHLLLGKGDWQPLLYQDANLVWDSVRASVALQPHLFRFKTSPRDVPPALENRRGADRDRYGNWYWVAAGGTEIRMLPVGQRRSIHYWSAADLTAAQPQSARGSFQPVTPPPAERYTLRGLAVTEHHYLVVGVLEPAGLLVFDLHGGGPPRRLLWPEAVPFVPLDLTPAPGGGLFVLDGGAVPRYWALDCNLDVIHAGQSAVPLEPPVPDAFRPAPSPPLPGEEAPAPIVRQRRQFPTGIVPELASPLDLAHPIAIEALPDGSVLVLEAGSETSHSTVHRFHWGKPVGEPFALVIPGDRLEENPDGTPASDQNLRGYDLAFVQAPVAEPGKLAGTLYVAATDGNQSFAFGVLGDESGTTFELELRYLPMRLFGGKGLVAYGTEAYYDYGDQWLPLTEQSRPRYEEKGMLTTAALDGKQPDCVWHRLFLDACIPNGAAITVESRAADDLNLLQDTPWQPEPVPYRRSGGAELPYYRPFAPDEETQDGAGTWELLLQQARGRYLQLRLTFAGTGRNTPRLRALRVYYPRFSYLREYLPDIYQQDAASASFLERFLANVEGLCTALEDRIAQAQVLFDIRSAPPEYLDWLAGWFGALLDPAWDDRRRRLFIAHAPELFRQRGTVPGLIRAIRLATDPCPDERLFTEDVTLNGGRSVRIVEGFLSRRAPGVVFGDPTRPEGPGVTTERSDWGPEQGAAPIHQRYRLFVQNRYQGDLAALNTAWERKYASFAEIQFPPVLPLCGAKAERETWRQFVQTGIGFTYAAVEPADVGRYQEFLARRYLRVEALNQAYQSAGVAFESFADVPLPAKLPESGRPLYDWMQFVSIYLPTVRVSHHFTVLIPTRVFGNTVSSGPRLDLVKRIVDQEKPAHTQFEVKEYWAMFRVGEARLGLDTYLEYGSRLAAILLGSGHLSQGYLAATHPWDVTDRRVVGRDRIQ